MKIRNMAFGWKTEFDKIIPADGLSNWEIFSIARQACLELGWDYLVVDEKTFTATTPTHWTLSEEIIRIVAENDTIIFKSQSESLELYEGGRNKNNIEELLLPAFRKIRMRQQSEQLQAGAAILKDETIKQLKSGSRIASEKMTFGFKDHEVTFCIITANVLIFILMMLKGVDPINPAVSDILEWGGNVKGYVTGGEWWRLSTAQFIHIGILPLLANVFGLYFIGLLVESILGKLKFLIAYLSAGVLASLVSIIWQPEGVIAGASGSVFGMYGVLFAFATTNYITKKFQWIWLVCVGSFAALNVVTGLHGGNDNAANFGGLVAGIIIGYLFYFFHFKKNVARAGGTRISVEVMLITSLLVFFYVRRGKDDSLQFEKAVMRLNQIEVKAMTQMQRLQEKSNNEASKFLRDTALPEWRHFQKEIMKTDTYSLDEEFKQKRTLLGRYADLRVKQTELIYKSIDQGTNKYDAKINEVSDKIDKIIDELGK